MFSFKRIKNFKKKMKNTNILEYIVELKIKITRVKEILSKPLVFSNILL